jgi:hypothetical protein
LREGVGELAEPEFVKDLIAENLIKAVKAAFRVLFFLPPQFLVEKVAQKLAAVASASASCWARPSGAVEKKPRSRSETALTRSSRGFFALPSRSSGEAMSARPLTLPSLIQMNCK